MGGIAQFGLSQLTPEQKASLVQQTPPTAPAPTGQTDLTNAATGQSSDIANPSAMPLNPPAAPGSTGDLEARAAQTFRQPQPQQQEPDPNIPIAAQMRNRAQIPPQMPQLSPDNPYASLVQDSFQKWQQLQPKPTGGGVKGLLSHFFQGMGGSMMAEAGLTPPDIQRQQQFHNLTMLTQLGTGWEDQRGMQRYRDALTSKMQQDSAFESQMQPLRLQEAQQAVQRGNEAATTIHPAMSSADLKSLGVPDDLAAQYQGKPLTSADFVALKDLSAAGQTKLFDYGQDGSGPGKGQWLVSGKDYTPIKQLSPISETGRATSLAKQQFAQQNALIKGMSAPVYAYDPVQKATVLTTQSQAQQGGMANIRGVKESDIRNDTHDTRVLNDVATKANNVMDSSEALNQNGAQRAMIAWAIDQASKEGQVRAGAFGVNLPTAWINNGFQSAEMMGATQATRDYVTNVLSLRESAMGLQKVLTGSARANESQIAALQATVPGFEADPSMARQKLRSFTQNVDLLRQGIPRMQGLDVVPVKTWSGPQSSIRQSVGSTPGGSTPGIGESLSTGAAAVKGGYHRMLQGLGLEGGGI